MRSAVGAVRVPVRPFASAVGGGAVGQVPEEGNGRTKLLRGGRWSVVGGRWSVGTVTVSSWSCHQLCWLLRGRGAGGAGLRAAAGLDWTGEGNWASQQLLQLASDQRTIKAWVRGCGRAWNEWMKRRWRGGRGGGGGAGKCASLKGQCFGGALRDDSSPSAGAEALWASRRVPSGGWRARSTKPPPRLMVDNLQAAGLLSRHWTFEHVENGKCGKQGVHMNPKSTMELTLLSCPRPGGTGTGREERGGDDAGGLDGGWWLVGACRGRAAIRGNSLADRGFSMFETQTFPTSRRCGR